MSKKDVFAKRIFWLIDNSIERNMNHWFFKLLSGLLQAILNYFYLGRFILNTSDLKLSRMSLYHWKFSLAHLKIITDN